MHTAVAIFLISALVGATIYVLLGEHFANHSRRIDADVETLRVTKPQRHLQLVTDASRKPVWPTEVGAPE
ncbi:hypothetical protein [Mycolicibacterium elephantis]|uniref:hypothetical protein n=1 Tax=Mycolicibacterium elephantis TaxID=81858 RepID=UPI0007EA21A4|nr:hypothetical protein [Mycolicibacterium elephantis]OBB20598.1 hypothetical protein A5762_15160 [Mycolicibacterium elephantis]